MRVLLFNLKRSTAIGNWPHYGLASLAAVLRRAGHDVQVADYMLTPAAPAPAEVAREFRPDVVGFSTYTALWSQLRKAIAEVKIALPTTPVMVGGPHATLYHEDLAAESQIDCVVCGEAEGAILSIVEGVGQRGPKVIHCEPPDVAGLPWPDFTAFREWQTITSYPLSTSRGCPFSCGFCPVSRIATRRWRPRQPAACIDELKNARRLMPHLASVGIIDDNPGLDRERLRQILALYAREIRLPLGFANLRADNVDGKFLELFKAAGGSTICIGAEHRNPEVFGWINKGETLEEVAAAAQLVKRAGFGLGLCFIIGLPHDRYEYLQANIHWARQFKPDVVYWNMAIPYRGTLMHEWFREHGRLLGEADRTSYVDFSPFCDEPAAETPEMSTDDRRKAYFYAMLRTDNYVFHLRDLPRLLSAARRWGLWAPLLLNLCFHQVRRLPDRLVGKLRRLKRR